MTTHSGQRGSALLLVLMALVVLAVIASAISRQARTTVRLAGASNSVLADREAARSAFEIGVATVLDRSRSSRRGGSEALYLIGDYTVSVEVMAEDGLVDLNLAEDREVYDALAAGRATPERRAAIEAVLDWRDPDDVARSVGAEAADYARTGLLPPRNGPFLSIFELETVLGVGEDELAQWLPVVTVSDVLKQPRERLDGDTTPESDPDRDDRPGRTQQTDGQGGVQTGARDDRRATDDDAPSARVRIIGSAWRGDEFAAAVFGIVEPATDEGSDVRVVEWRYLSQPYGGAEDLTGSEDPQ